MIILFITSSCQNPISETGYSTTDLNHPEFSYAGAKGTTGSVRNPMSVSPTSFNNNGFTATCTVLPALPPGLSIHPSTCVISGTPLNSSPKTNYIVTAQNIAGLTRESVVLNVIPSKPTISYTTGVGLVNQVFTHAPTLYNNDSPITGCAITPALPDGFSFDPLTCVVTGESEEFISSQTHSVTVTNAIGSTTTNMTFMIAALPILSYSGVSTAGTVANAMSITPSELDIQGAAVTSCTTSPALPNGLEINNETCVISGTPSVIDSRSYTVTATNPVGSSTASLSLSILPSSPFIGYSGVLGLGFVALPFLASPSLLVDNGALITNCAPVGGLPSGLSVHPNTCVISGIPSGISSSSPYTIRATNSAGYTDASVLISISPSAPTISYSGVSGSAVYNSSFTMAPGILNLNGASISSCTISPALPSGLSIHNSTCAISGSPSELSPLTTYTVTVQNSAGSSTGTLSISVTGGTLSFTEDGVPQTIPIHLPGGVAGASCSPLSFSGNSLVTTTISGIHPDCLASIQPNSNQNGSGSLTLSFNNTSSPSTTLGFSVAPVDDAPVSSALSQTINEDVTTFVTLNYTDVEGHPATTCALSNLTNLTGTCSCSSGVCQGSIRGTSNYFGSGSFTYTVNANGVNSNSSLASITINSVDDAPVASSVSGTLIEDTQGTVNLSYTDVESHEATTCTLSNLSNLTGSCACTSGTCTATVTGTSNHNGSASFNYTVTANGLTSNSVSATVTISAVDDAPVGNNISSTINEDVTTLITLSYTDVDSHLATSCTLSNLSNLSGTCSCSSGTCQASVTGPSHFNGNASFSYTVTANGLTTNVATALVTISAVDDAPVSSNVSGTLTEDTQGTVTLSYTDIESNQAATCTLSSLSNLTGSCACASGTCTATVTGSSNFNGSASFSYTVTANGLTSNAASASVSISAVDDAPVASNVSATINEDVATQVTLSYSDVEGHQGATCNLSSLSNLTGTCACTSGTCRATVTGSSNFNGSASFSYTVTANGLTSNAATASITVSPVDDAPVASNVSATINEDVATQVTLSYSDVEGHQAATCNLSSLSNLTGTCACTSGTCRATVTGSSNFNGSASFNYTVTANGLTSNSASASITISAVNDAPVVASIGAQTTNEDTTKVVSFTISDVDSILDCSSSVSVTSSSPVSSITKGGTAPNCTLTVVPIANLNGSSSIGVTVSDGTLTASTSFTINVSPVDDAPVASNVSGTISEDVAGSISLSYTDADSDKASACTLSSLSNLTGTCACNASTGVCTASVTGASNYNGAASFSYTVTANGVTSNSASASVTISAVNDAPVLGAISAQSTNSGVSKSVTLNVSDIDNAITCSSFVTATSSNTTLLPNANIVNGGSAPGCTLTMTPGSNQSGTVTVTVTASDGLLSSVQAFTLTVGVTCPTGYIPVPGNTTLGTNSFCVMKYEAKNNGSGVAVSQAAGNLYVSLTIGASQAKCTDLNALNGVSNKYDLISNPEWMTIARNAEGVGANWEAGTSGSGAMFRGHSDTSPGSALSAAADNDPYNGTGNTNIQAMGSGKEQKRTFTLSNGEVIWDLSGNVWEWVDWSHTAVGLQLGPTTCAASWTELPNVSCVGLSSSQYMPFITNLTSTNGVGRFVGGSGGAALRGGGWGNGSGAGAFTLLLSLSTTSTDTAVGFRCVYRP